MFICANLCVLKLTAAMRHEEKQGRCKEKRKWGKEDFKSQECIVQQYGTAAMATQICRNPKVPNVKQGGTEK